MKAVHDLPITAKMLGNSIILLMLLLLASGYAWYSMDKIGDELESIAKRDIPLSTALTHISELQLDQAIHFERALRFGERGSSTSGSLAKFNEEVNHFKAFHEKIDEEIMRGVEMTNPQGMAVHSDEEAAEFERVNKELVAMEKQHADYHRQAEAVFALVAAGKMKDVEAMAASAESMGDKLTDRLEGLHLEMEKFTEQAALRAVEHESEAVGVLTVITIVSVLTGGIISLFVASDIIRRLDNTADAMKTIATGNLTQPIKVQGRDEIGALQQSMKTMQDGLVGIISQIDSTTQHLSSTAEEVSAVMRQTSGNIHKQQQETEQVSTAMNEMSIAVGEISRSVVGASSAANSANAESDKGQHIVEDAVQSIQQLAARVEETAQVIGELNRDSENINTVLDVIKGIAEQTNLLALNAAIEAARAGDQGRGFAVVADEVRTLAGRTQESTEEINAMIDKLQSGAHKAVQAMSENQGQAAAVVEKARHAGESLSAIASSVAHIDDMSSEIATASEEQNAVAGNMNSNIKHISDMALENATSIEQTTQAGNDLARVAVELQGMVEKFQIKS